MSHCDVRRNLLVDNSFRQSARVTAVCGGLLLACAGPLCAQAPPQRARPLATGTGRVTYGDEGLELRSADNTYRAVIGFRNQLRFTSFLDQPDAGVDASLRQNDFRLMRSRLRVNGHVFTPRLEYQVQLDFVEERLRDASVTYTVTPWARVRAGRWKVEMSRERIASSGEQQLADRSIVDRWFTFGRQQGIEMFGTVAPTRRWSGMYWVGAFRGVDERGGALLPTLLARYQWNFAGRQVPFEEGDPQGSNDLRLAVAVGASRKNTPFTLFTGAGVGEHIPDLVRTGRDRYLLQQVTSDVSLKWRGISLQSEVHRRTIRGVSTQGARALIGAYVQGGVLASTVWERAPRPLELSARVAAVDPDRDGAGDTQREDVVGANWYFQGHRNKISVDVSRLHSARPEGTRTTDLRTRLQWEITF